MNIPLYQWLYYGIKITIIWMVWASNMLIPKNIKLL